MSRTGMWTTATDRWCPHCGEKLSELRAQITASFDEIWWKVDGKWVFEREQNRETEAIIVLCDICGHTISLDADQGDFNHYGLDHEPTEQERDNARLQDHVQ